MNEAEKLQIHKHVIIEEDRLEETIQEEIEGATDKAISPVTSAPLFNEFSAKKVLRIHSWDIAYADAQNLHSAQSQILSPSKENPD